MPFLSSRRGAALGNLEDTRPCMCAGEGEREHGLRVGALFSS